MIMMNSVSLWIIFSILVFFPQFIFMVKQEDFKTCDQSSFCARQRAYAEYSQISSGWKSPYEANLNSLTVNPEKGNVALDIKNTKEDVLFTMNVDFLRVGPIRVRIDEKTPLKKRYTGAADFSLIAETLTGSSSFKQTEKSENQVEFNFNDEYLFHIQAKPFKFEIHSVLDRKPVFVFNHRGYLHFEHMRPKPEQPDSDIVVPENASELEIKKVNLVTKMKKDMWAESFNGKEDTKPNGPTSMGIDVSFPDFHFAYGLPEHGANFSLKPTRGENAVYTEPYRLYNLDVFEYIVDSPMALYGHIPYITAHRKGQTVGLLWVNAAEMWVDVYKPESQKSIDFHWSTESGIIDLIIFLGKEPYEVQKQLNTLTGPAHMPQMFATAYHQCRWNYNDEQDVQEVDQGFDQHGIPYDVMWLDIEHTDDKRYFTWHKSNFPTPEKMQANLASKGRKLVSIVDPHIKTDSSFYVYKDAKDKGFFVKDRNKNDFSGWCWPGDSSWIDYVNPDARKYWADLFAYDKYKGSTPICYTWNDMNEPSVFTGPEITMPKDNIHFGGWEHRDIHNLYGMLQQSSTHQGHLSRNKKKDRPFILSRAFFIGTQRYGPIWTGDNFALWEHLEASVPMILSCGVAGMPFTGADVGGFFGNPDAELLLRWYQVGAFQPFFRAHAHIDTRRREPWLFGDKVTALIRDAVVQRYKNLPYIYTLNFLANRMFAPVMRPMYYEFPDDEKTLDMGDQFMLGPGILVKPVTQPGTKSINVYLPSSSMWYNYYTHELMNMEGKTMTEFKTPMDKIGVFYRGGHIISRKERIRKSSSLMKHDPYTLLIALDSQQKAMGTLYVDDGSSYDHEEGKYIWANFSFDKETLTSSLKRVDSWRNELEKESETLRNRVERVVILGAKREFKKAIVKNEEGKTIRETFVTSELGTLNTFELVVKDPSVMVGEVWSIAFE